MAYNAKINPQFGNASQNILLDLKLDSQIKTRIRIENATHGLIVKEFILPPEVKEVTKEINLQIPEFSSDSLISIFVNIEVEENNEFHLSKIIPLIYYVQNDVVNSSESVVEITPLFASLNDTVKISINGDSGEEYNIYINDKVFNIIINEDGFGSIHFETKEVILSGSDSVLHKFPIYYSYKDDYDARKFGGQYLHILPSNLKSFVDDSRCATYDPLTWEVPSYCDDTPPVDPNPFEPEIPENDAPSKKCDYDDCDNRPCDCEGVTQTIDSNACRIHRSSSTLLSNGMAVNAYVSVDTSIDAGQEGYNKQRVFIKSDETAMDSQVVASEHVALLPKASNDDFIVYITEELYTSISAIYQSGKTVIAVLMDDKTEYKGFEIKDLLEPDEYTPFYSLIIDRDDSLIAISELNPCVYTIFYEFDTNIVPPSIIVPSNIARLPFIELLSSGEKITITNVSVSSNYTYRGSQGESFVHVIAEGYVSGDIQLFYYGFSIGPSGYSSTNSDNWVQLTNLGSNKNAKTVTDKYNNLHIFWESDRTNSDQIYYGVIGPSSVFYGNAVLSSIIDKKAALEATEKSFDYLSSSLLESTGQDLQRISEQGVVDEYTGATTYPNKGILNTAWIKNITNDGSVNVSEIDDISSISIESSVLSDTALAFTKLDDSSFLELSSGRLSQINYQISFDFNGEISQDISDSSTILTVEDVEEAYKDFKDQFIEKINSNVVTGLPFYELENNRFIVGSEIEIYDRFIPIFGSYKNENLANFVEGNTITDNFTIWANGENRNLNHYFVAVVPEKVRFKASNIEDEDSFIMRLGTSYNYVSEIEEEYYTGRVVLAIVYTSDYNLIDGGGTNIIIRNISDTFKLLDNNNITLLVNYSKMFSEDTAKFFTLPSTINEDFTRFVCSLTLLRNDNPIVAESFIVDMSDKYRSFDIGFGIPSQGCFKSDNFTPYNSSVFENAFISFNYSNIVISSPTYQINSDICSIPEYIREQHDLSNYDFYGNTEDMSEKFLSNYNRIFEGTAFDPSIGGYSPVLVEDPSTGIFPDNIDIQTQAPFTLNEFMQIPISLEGWNSNVSVDLDWLNELHITWQSNRDSNWNIFYSNSIDKNMPFRFDTKISNSDSNSLSPSVSIDKTGKRMIVWHDDRDGNFNIYSARALEGGSSFDNFCEKNSLLQYINNVDDYILTQNEGSISSNIITDSVIVFEQHNEDILDKDFHFRITFYSDSLRERAVYSSSSILDNRRWYVSGDTYGVVNDSGVTISPSEAVDIVYVPDIYPQQLFRQQTNIDLEIGRHETPLLSGVKYYLTIESYDISSGTYSVISHPEFFFKSSHVETSYWRENLDSNYWICSANGQLDLLVSNVGDQSIFPSIKSNIFDIFYITNQSLIDGSYKIANSYWDSARDIIYGSGQGLWSSLSSLNGFKPQTITDQGQNFYSVSTDDSNFYSFKCSLPEIERATLDPSILATIEEDTLCEPGTLNTLNSSFTNVIARVAKNDVVGSFVINQNEIISVIEKTNINIDIAGIYGAYAVRLRNQNGFWSDWINIDYSDFIENNRFIVPWTISRSNGLRSICYQVLTVYGVTEIKCINIFVNISTIDYIVKYFYDSDRTEEVNNKDGFALLSTQGEDSKEIYVRVIFNEVQNYDSGELVFDVSHQGISDIFNKALDPENTIPTTNYIGSFTIKKEDGIYSKDGTGFLKIKFPEEEENDICVYDKRDLYNQTLASNELEFLDTALLTPEESFNEAITRTTLKLLEINDFKQYYEQDDRNRLFGDLDFYRN